MSVSGQTRLFGLVGHPVRHSLSPAMYNALFARYGVDAVYVAFDVDPRRAGAVASAIRTLDLVGVNLTVPFKERILPDLDHLTAAAAEAGAVNVVIQVDGALAGYNTDGEGLCNSLEAEGRHLPGCRAVLLGAGGTARAVASALLDRGAAHITLLNRSPARAEAAAAALASIFGAARLAVGPLEPAAFAQAAEGAHLVFNGLAGGAEAQVAALDPAPLAPNADWVDANYWMARPPQAERCAALGLRFHSGHAMLLHQGALAFELFTGQPVTADEIRALLEPR
jgi:shikimate dehydrogenase